MLIPCCVTTVTLIHFINGNYHIKQLKSRKSHKTCLTNHTQSTSHHITPLVIKALGIGHTTHTQTHMHTNTQNKAIRRKQVHCLHAPGLTYKQAHIYKMIHTSKFVSKIVSGAALATLPVELSLTVVHVEYDID